MQLSCTRIADKVSDLYLFRPFHLTEIITLFRDLWLALQLQNEYRSFLEGNQIVWTCYQSSLYSWPDP